MLLIQKKGKKKKEGFWGEKKPPKPTTNPKKPQPGIPWAKGSRGVVAVPVVVGWHWW